MVIRLIEGELLAVIGRSSASSFGVLTYCDVFASNVRWTNWANPCFSHAVAIKG